MQLPDSCDHNNMVITQSSLTCLINAIAELQNHCTRSLEVHYNCKCDDRMVDMHISTCTNLATLFMHIRNILVSVSLSLASIIDRSWFPPYADGLFKVIPAGNPLIHIPYSEICLYGNALSSSWIASPTHYFYIKVQI